MNNPDFGSRVEGEHVSCARPSDNGFARRQPVLVQAEQPKASQPSAEKKEKEAGK